MEDEEVGDDLEEVSEPHIFSTDPNERKLARRLRIHRRLEAVRKQQLQDEGVEEVEEVVKTLLEAQVENSADQLQKLLLEGKELVTNVRVANDTREVLRRELEVEAREQRLQKLEEEANASMIMFEAVQSKWEKITLSNDPLDIFHDIEAQKVKCRELIDQKNAMIEELRKEILLVDERFDKDQIKQKGDLALIVQRIDKQVNVMRSAYRQELQLIEQAINTERRQQIDAANKRWETLYKEREKDEVSNMAKKFEQVNELAQEIHAINVEHQERFRETKIKLESDIQVLQQELEQMKALCLLNSEKLDYNFQVLKKRDEENVIIKAQLKRRLNKLQDVYNSLRKKINDMQQTTESEKIRLTDDVIRLHHNIIDIEAKADHFSEVNDKIYHEVWKMNLGEAKKLLDKILTTDRLIYEQQLGLDWTPPDMSLLDTTELESYQSAMQVVAELFTKRKALDDTESVSSDGIPAMQVAFKRQRSERHLLRHILQRVADQSGFLIEERIFSLLFPYTKNEKTLVKIDTVFFALGIKSESDMMMLRNFFLPYAYCPTCAEVARDNERHFSQLELTQETEIKPTVMFQDDVDEKLHSDDYVDEEVVHIDSNEILIRPPEIISVMSEAVEDHNAMVSSVVSAMTTSTYGGVSTGVSSVRFTQADKAEESNRHLATMAQTKHYVKGATPSKLRSKCGTDHKLIIDPIYVLKALRDFITQFTEGKDKEVINMSYRLATKRSTVSRMLATGDVSTFWSRFRQIFTPDREKLWDGLYVGLQKYHVILEERHRLNKETEKLRSQNIELRRLLQRYMTINVMDPRTFPPIEQMQSSVVKKPSAMKPKKGLYRSN